MMLMDYHLVFIVLAFLLLLVSITFIFVDTTPQKIIAAMLLSGINTTLCTINYLSFFGIGIIGYTSTGAIDVTTYGDMYPVFMFFFGLYWVNVILIFYCWYKYTYTVWTKGG
jgi:hypothetical protein